MYNTRNTVDIITKGIKTNKRQIINHINTKNTNIGALFDGLSCFASCLIPVHISSLDIYILSIFNFFVQHFIKF